MFHITIDFCVNDTGTLKITFFLHKKTGFFSIKLIIFFMNKTFFENVDCISLTVKNLDEGLAFYRDALNLKLLWQTKTSCGLGMDKDITEVVLTTADNPMVDFKVENVLEAIQKFTKAGGKVEYGPFDIDIGKCAVMSDPWGNSYCILDMTKGTYDVDETGAVTGVSQK